MIILDGEDKNISKETYIKVYEKAEKLEKECDKLIRSNLMLQGKIEAYKEIINLKL